jgi:amino acid transporter
MAQQPGIQSSSHITTTDDHTAHGNNMLGPILCWAVVFADIGTSVYYVPGILYGTAGIGDLAGFFVLLTMSVFVLLTFKYAEVTHRFPQGGGVVTVASQALNRWFGALGGMFILVDYFLTAAISCLSGMQYLSVVILPLGATVLIPGLGQFQLTLLVITIVILVLLGILNWIGISESAKVSLVGAIIAFLSDLAILFTVFTHISLTTFFSLFPEMFHGHPLTSYSILVGFAGSFLAFSGLESISQLSPVMRQPRKKIAGIALFLVVITIGLTSPLLTMLSTILQPQAAKDPLLSAQLISLLGGHWGNVALQTEVAISASALLVFASNTAIIGSYHVFIALSRMEFLPSFVLKRNKLRGTPHYSIMLAAGIPILILIAVLGNINILGDMYAFGLLGAFTLTCLGLDIIRYRDWQAARRAMKANQLKILALEKKGEDGHLSLSSKENSEIVTNSGLHSNGHHPEVLTVQVSEVSTESKGLWFKIAFFLGVLTTILVMVAWSTNLVTKPLATAFGGSVTLLGMLIAVANYTVLKRRGRVPVPLVITRIGERLPDSILAILTPGSVYNDAVIQAAVHQAEAKRPVVFFYVSDRQPRQEAPQMLEIVDPYFEDQEAKKYFSKAENLALKAKISDRRFLYQRQAPNIEAHVWQLIHPQDTVMTPEDSDRFSNINPDRIRYEATPDGKVVHLLKKWQ